MFLEYVSISVFDLEQSIGSYLGLFDFEVRWRGKIGDSQKAAHIGTDRICLALFQASETNRFVSD